jgi:hypothetical protein
VLELIDEHGIRAGNEEARISGRGCPRLRLVQVEQWLEKVFWEDLQTISGKIYRSYLGTLTGLCWEVSPSGIGWQRGPMVLKDPVRELRPPYLPPAPASRVAYEPGELAQGDFWFQRGADRPSKVLGGTGLPASAQAVTHEMPEVWRNRMVLGTARAGVVPDLDEFDARRRSCRISVA